MNNTKRIFSTIALACLGGFNIHGAGAQDRLTSKPADNMPLVPGSQYNGGALVARDPWCADAPRRLPGPAPTRSRDA